MKLLHIDSSVLGPHSVSRQVSSAIASHLRQATPGLETTYRDLTSTPLTHLSGSHLAAMQGAPSSAEVQAELAAGQAVLEEFLAADIIVLGETVTGVEQGLAGTPISALTVAVGLVAVVVGFGAWWTYFDFAGHRPPRRAPASAVFWQFAHLPLTASVAAMGARWSDSSNTPTTDGLRPPRPGCFAAAQPQCSAPPCW